MRSFPWDIKNCYACIFQNVPEYQLVSINIELTPLNQPPSYIFNEPTTHHMGSTHHITPFSIQIGFKFVQCNGVFYN